jgi:lysophospholipid acyltransferase (LPLAT)-like uncharacterized protein
MAVVRRLLSGYILPFLIVPLYWLYTRSWRFHEHGPEDVLEKFVRGCEPCVFAHWHGDELALIGYNSYRGLAVLSSLSKDGTIMANCLRLLGYRVFRGSSSRGGVRGLIGLIRAGKSGTQTALAVDGPKGPIHEVKSGIVELARKTGNPIIPVYSLSDRSWFVPRSWNKCYLPKFFALVDIHFGPAIYVQPDDSREIICRKVKEGLR